MKRLHILFLTIFFLVQAYSGFADTGEKKTILYLFWQKNCIHCAEEKKFLKNLQDKYPYLQVQEMEISENTQNLDLLEKMSQELHFQVTGLPVTIINQRYFIGFLDENTSGKEMEAALIEEHQNGQEHPSLDSKITSLPDTIKVPFFKTIQIHNLSLSLLSALLGAIDGFNPCAMWVLILLLSILIGIHDRTKLIFLGILFLLASAFVYFLFLAAWLNLMLFIRYISVIKLVIGGIALLVGGYYLKEFWTNKEGVCKVTGGKQKAFLARKLEQLLQEKHFFLAAGGIVLLAFLVNIIELVCSAGIPAIYTQVLALSPVSRVEHYWQIFIYLFFFLLDDLIVFLVAIFSLHLMNITAKYTRYSHLIGGILLTLIGLLLFFKPQWLMFS